MNKSSGTKKSKDNSSGAANDGYNKNKDSNKNKKDQQSNTISSVNKNSSMKCTHFVQDGRFAIKCFKNPHGESYKSKPVSFTGEKKMSI